ncbi:hypothetical protein HMPREF9278_0560 [Mobiluncus mulieris FB024-16]|nr:hypothetical protein HMPREF9278_0560 [Mobiluncus mulieris FB024-16]
MDLRGLAREWEWRLVNPTENHGQPRPGITADKPTGRFP